MQFRSKLRQHNSHTIGQHAHLVASTQGVPKQTLASEKSLQTSKKQWIFFYYLNTHWYFFFVHFPFENNGFPVRIQGLLEFKFTEGRFAITTAVT